jgi:hypothetical protein
LSQGEARGDHEEVVRLVLGAGGALEEPLDIIEDHEEDANAEAI